MQLPPMDVLLSWPTPNYVDPKDVRGPQLLIVTLVLFPIALITVALRVFTRLHISKSWGIDDWFLLVAIPPTAACAVLTIMAVQKWGWNRHIWDVPLNLLTLGLKFTVAAEVSFAVAVSATKLSMLILTRRILASGTGILRRVAAVVMFIVAADAAIFCVVVIFACGPPSAYWTLSEQPQKCINERVHLLLSGSINTITDFFIVLLPLPTMFRLKIPRRQQIIVCALFGAGFAICVAGVFRIFFEWKTASSYDRTWESYGLWISSCIELYVGVICTSIPACKPFFTRYIPMLIGSPSGLSKPSHHSHSHSRGVPPHCGPSKTTTAFITQEKHFSRSFSSGPYSPLELPRIAISKFSTRINSKQLLPLSYLDVLPENPGRVQESKERRPESNETSISFFVGANPSPGNNSDFGNEGQGQGQGQGQVDRDRENGVGRRSESVEESVKNLV